MALTLGTRRGVCVDVTELSVGGNELLSAADRAAFESFDELYRCLCALLYNYVPMSGHPGGSISSGRFVQGIVFDAADYDLSDPDRCDADVISYAAGHKALGLYAMWALRTEIARLAAPELLPRDDRQRLRLEDLLGFRRNPVADTPLFKQFHAKPLDGHPTPATPFVRLATGASGVGVASSLGLALGAADYYGKNAPIIHIVEGEGGLTPGRVSEALAAAGTASLGNVVLHVDWNQASIDSNRVCRDGETPGDYVQWNPMELFALHDWNVIYVPDGTDFAQIISAQRHARSLTRGQPTAIVYRTTKGWQYGIEGRASHGAGHKLCSDGFYQALSALADADAVLPTCDAAATTCRNGCEATALEACFWEALTVVRWSLRRRLPMAQVMAERLCSSKSRLEQQHRQPRRQPPRVERIYEIAQEQERSIPAELLLSPGTKTTLRAELGRVLNYLNKASGGAVFAAAADLLDSTSIAKVGDGFGERYWNAAGNPGSRLLSIGGICEDAMCGVLSGLATFGRHIGSGASYGAFMAPLGHIAARLHAIGQQARRAELGEAYNPFVMVCAHAGLKTGEDGPTHADPQALQLLQDNFPRGTMITLTPWDPQELWPVMAAALARRPAVIAPFVTRPNETVLDRGGLGLAPATAAVSGMYRLRRAAGDGDGVLVIQGSGVAYEFVQGALPRLERDGLDLNVYYISSLELFDLLPVEEQERLYPAEHAQVAMGITGFTLATMYRWIMSSRGRAATLHPYGKSHYLGSGQAERVLQEAGLDGESQYEAVVKYVRTSKGRKCEAARR